MASGNYSLATTVSFLEAVLRAVGHEPVVVASEETRESLRERLRSAVRLIKRFRVYGDLRLQGSSVASAPLLGWLGPGNCSSDQSSFCDIPSVQPYNCFTPNPPVSPETDFRSLADVYIAPGFYSPPSEIYERVSLTPFGARAPSTIFDVAMRVAVDGITCVLAAVMDIWSLRHHVVSSPSSDKRKSRRRRSLDRLFLALMRFAFGFFGSHKVDARNNP